MTRQMYDAVSAREIPPHVQLAAGYLNGDYAWTQADWNRFPGPSRVSIDVHATIPLADILDVENGDAGVTDAPSWVGRHNDAHDFPAILYCARATLTPLFNELAAKGFHVGADFRLWIATLDGTQRVADMTGVLGIQYRSTPGYDVSVIYDDAWKAVSRLGSVPPPAHEEYRAQNGDTWDSIAATHHLTGQQLFAYNLSPASGRPQATRVLLQHRGINTLYINELVVLP